MNPFSALTSKIFAGLSTVLLAAVVWLFLSNQNLKRDLLAEQNSHLKTKADVAAASAQAQVKVSENLQRVTSEQEKVNEKRLASLRSRLADAERLRAKSEAAARSASKAGVSSLPAPAERVAEATCATSGRDVDDIEALIRYDELISWVIETHAIPTSPTEK